MVTDRGRERGWREIADHAVRANLVVVPPPGRDHCPGMLERRKPVFVEALVTEIAGGAFDLRVLRRLAELNQDQLHAFGLRRLGERPTGNFRRLVSLDQPGPESGGQVNAC